jgi:hypothetical protein
MPKLNVQALQARWPQAAIAGLSALAALAVIALRINAWSYPEVLAFPLTVFPGVVAVIAMLLKPMRWYYAFALGVFVGTGIAFAYVSLALSRI